MLKGFLTGGSLIVAIGAQNAFVIRQGLLRQHRFLTALLCSLLDALFISLGAFGFGAIISLYPAAIALANFLAISFLLVYGAISIRSALKNRSLDDSSQLKPRSKRTIILLILALTILNPHVYLDTILLLGSITAQQVGSLQMYFALGAILASFAWFFALTYGSGFFSRYLRSPKVWKCLDILIGLIMWGVASFLLLSWL